MGQIYEEFIKRAGELADIGHAQALLGWDQETYMPSRGAARRASSMGTLAGLYHQKLTDPNLVRLVEELQGRDLQGDQAVNVREFVRGLDRALKIPEDLVVEMSKTEALAHEAWVEARQKADFAVFQPWLEKLLAQKKEVADRVGYQGSIYNALLDEYEPYARAEEIAPVFADLRARLVPLVEAIQATGKMPAKGVLDQEFPVAAQEAFGRQVMADLGFDLEAGRLDISVHPFCSGLSRDDVRLTTRYAPGQMTDSLFGVIHETGHGLYEQGLPEDAVGTPAGASVSLGIHESQSRLWENMVGRSRPFWSHYLDTLKNCFPAQLQGVGLDAFYAAVNQVEPSLIRVEADEVTYNLHILLRFELEMDMVEGRVEVADLPALWNERMEQYLGVRPEDDAEGVLQDIHWSMGGIGYFPTYSLGNLYGAQFFRQAQLDMPDLMGQIGQGDFSPLKKWLNDKVHARGSRLSAGELVQEVTGEPLQARYFVDYLEEKFGALYELG
ncbi:MAG: carboxypeptidase M32 [Candidatus Latescibacteria bacterium]|nr:carboxypeptidase M32 [Candidatus Latescibacterota bacterium]